MVQVKNYLTYGIVLKGDLYRFINEAEMLLSGQFPSRPLYLFYISYDFFVAFFLWTGLGVNGIIAGQLCLSIVAAYYLYRLATELFTPEAGIIAVFLYVCCHRMHMYNLMIISEILFISMMIITTYFLLKCRSSWQWSVVGLMVLFTSFCRPNGLFYLVAVIVYILYLLYKAKRKKLVIGFSFVSLVAGILALNWITNAEREVFQGIIQTYCKGQIIYDYWQVVEYKGEQINFSGNENMIIAIALFIVNNFWFFLKLATIKLFVFFVFVRPFLPWYYNVFSVVTMVPLYIFALWGLFGKLHNPGIKVIVVTFCFLQAACGMLVGVEPDGRFFLPTLPLIFVFSARGLLNIRVVNKFLHQFVK